MSVIYRYIILSIYIIPGLLLYIYFSFVFVVVFCLYFLMDELFETLLYLVSILEKANRAPKSFLVRDSFLDRVN